MKCFGFGVLGKVLSGSRFIPQECLQAFVAPLDSLASRDYLKLSHLVFVALLETLWQLNRGSIQLRSVLHYNEPVSLDCVHAREGSCIPLGVGHAFGPSPYISTSALWYERA